MPESIKTCPFCSSHNVDYFSSFADAVSLATVKGFADTFNIECINCGAQGASKIGKEKAIAAWNNRAYNISTGNTGDTDNAGAAITDEVVIAKMKAIISALADSETLPNFRELKKTAQSLLDKLKGGE